MSAHDPRVPLRQMRDAAQRALEIAMPLSRAELAPDRVETLALTRLLEILGEAARRVPIDVRDENEAIPWRQIAGTRDRLIHAYDRIDLDILWTIVQDQLPPLIDGLDELLERLGRS